MVAAATEDVGETADHSRRVGFVFDCRSRRELGHLLKRVRRELARMERTEAPGRDPKEDQREIRGICNLLREGDNLSGTFRAERRRVRYQCAFEAKRLCRPRC